MAMGIGEIRQVIIHGSKEKQTINNIKDITYQATIQHIKDSVARSKREREKDFHHPHFFKNSTPSK